jgi:DNA repair exonuclease SbcCD ATPase subunit
LKATLQLLDVGGFKGKREYDFESKSLNIIEAPNSGGKSSLVKALLAVLSVPSDGKFESYFLKDAKKLGIKSDELNTQEGFVNIHREMGEVTLNYNNKEDSYKVKQSGDYLQLPAHGDQKFLFSGILSNTTKILRQLDNTDEDNEPDDFKWAVTLLSNAKNYDEIVSHLKDIKEQTERKKLDAESEIKRRESLKTELNELTTELASIDKLLKELEPKFKGKTELLGERKKIITKIESITKEIQSKDQEIKRVSSEQSTLEKKINKLECQIDEDSNKLNSLALFGQKVKDKKKDELEYLKNEKIAEINDEISDLKEERGKIDGVYNLLYIAQTNIKDRHAKSCPLCNEGTLTSDLLNERYTKLKKEKDEISSQIMDKSQAIRSIVVQFDNIVKEKKRLESNLSTNKDTLRAFKNKIKGINRNVRELKNDLENKEKQKNDYEYKLSELRDLISLDDEEVNEMYTTNENKKTKLIGKIDYIENEINNATIEIDGDFYSPDSAKKITSQYIEFVSEGINYAKQMAEKQRQEAANRFNSTIQSLMEELSFTEFKDIRLNRDFRLYIERFDPDTQEYVSQLASTLCTSEKLTIALMLQIALKETYLPHIPFLIIDDVIEDFDEERRQKIYDFLYSKSIEQDWIVIATKLVEDKDPLRVVQYSSN